MGMPLDASSSRTGVTSPSARLKSRQARSTCCDLISPKASLTDETGPITLAPAVSNRSAKSVAIKHSSSATRTRSPESMILPRKLKMSECGTERTRQHAQERVRLQPQLALSLVIHDVERLSRQDL